VRTLQVFSVLLFCITADSQEHSVHASHLVTGSVLRQYARQCLAPSSCYSTGLPFSLCKVMEALLVFAEMTASVRVLV